MLAEKNILALHSEHYWQRQHQHQHWHCCFIRPPPPICPVAHANSLILTAAADWCSWVKVHGSWSWRGISLPSMPSQRASWPCQPSLGEIVKKIPLQGGLWCSLEQSIPKTSSVELPFSPGQSLPGRERSAGDRCHMRPLYPAAAFSTNPPSAKCDVKHPVIWEESSVSLLISFHCYFSVTKAKLTVVFFSLDHSKMLRHAMGCRKNPLKQDTQS